MITGLDYVILVLYFVGLILLSVYLGRGFVDLKDFFLGSRRIPAWAIGASITATQAGVISMISAPAFVAARPGGGLVWLQYELAVPLAMIPIMLVLVPCFYRTEVVTVYQYLERRFDVHTRTILSLVFQVSRGLATGVAIYAAAILLSVVLDAPLWVSILLMGLIALAYTAIGGMAAVIWSDVIQLAILWAGIFVVMGYAGGGGGWTAILSSVPPERFQALDFASHGLGDGATFSFWPMVVGGFFLYVSYYGCDQSQMQRTLSAASVKDSQLALWYGGLVRFPLVLSYTLVGSVLAVFLLAVLSRRVGAAGVLAGLVTGVGTNLGLWLWFDPGISRLWWNATGCLVAVAYPVGLAGGARPPGPSARDLTLDRQALRDLWRAGKPLYLVLAWYFIAIVLLSYGLGYSPALFLG